MGKSRYQHAHGNIPWMHGVWWSAVKQLSSLSSKTTWQRLPAGDTVKVKEVDLYSVFIVVPHTQGTQVWITQCYLQFTPYLPLPLKHLPDGASVTIRFHASHNIVLGSDGYLYILSHFGCLPNASLDWPVWVRSIRVEASDWPNTCVWRGALFPVPEPLSRECESLSCLGS